MSLCLSDASFNFTLFLTHLRQFHYLPFNWFATQIRDYSFGTYAQFSEKLTFETNIFNTSDTWVCVLGVRNVSFWNILRTYQTNDPILGVPITLWLMAWNEWYLIHQNIEIGKNLEDLYFCMKEILVLNELK